MGLQSTKVTIMSSMDEHLNDHKENSKDLLEKHEKPGYSIRSFVKGFSETAESPVPEVETKKNINDIIATIFVRCGFGRNNYRVSPGLYCVGNPDKNSEVLVTANFKLTFDQVRQALKEVNAWILVLDTKGVNVWCAAGKGTFSTTELVKQIKESSLGNIVGHKRVILPQLGATGVAAREVKKKSGFRVVYGPVRAKDIPTFLKKNRKADKKMRTVTFSFMERLILTPVELNAIIKPSIITLLILIVLSGFGPDIFSLPRAAERSVTIIAALFIGIFSGAIFSPTLLPYLPFRKFAAKGIISGSLFACLFLSLIVPKAGIPAGISIYLFITTISSFLTMNFTGATPFTSPSGVEKEMKQFIPVQLISIAASTGLWIYSAF